MEYESKPTVLGDEAEQIGNGPLVHDGLWEQFEVVPAGGVRWKDEEALKRQRGVVWQIVKNIGNNLLEGRDLISTTLPVTVFEPRSFLEVAPMTFGYVPTFMPLAAEAKDPLERFKLVMACAIAGVHLQMTMRKPFNPILGETLEGSLSDELDVYCQQTSHHPPISNFLIEDRKKRFRISGYGEFQASIRGNTLKGLQKGPMRIEFFDDGTVIEWNIPVAHLKGIAWGDRIAEYMGVMTFTNKKHNLICELAVNPDQLGFFKSWFSKQSTPSHYVYGKIFRVDPENPETREELCTATGSWLHFLEFDGVRYWDLERVVPSVLTLKDNPLPCDCRRRVDLIALRDGDEEKSQELKSALETKQRNEKKLRKEGESERGQADSPKGKNKEPLVASPKSSAKTRQTIVHIDGAL